MMNLLIAYPTDDEMRVGFSENNGSKPAFLSIGYPTSHEDFENAIKEAFSEMGNPVFDIGVACYGMTQKTDKPSIELTSDVIKSLSACEYGMDPSNMTSVLIHALNPNKAILAYPLTYDCLSPIARLSGIPEIERRMVARTMDHLMAGEGKKTLTVYLSQGEMSVCAQDKGKVIDITNSYDGEGPMTPTRSGFFQQKCVYSMAFSGKYSREELLDKIRVRGGLLAYLGTSDLDEVYGMIDGDDEKAKLIYDAMLYTLFKEIGSKSAWLCGDFESIVLTGPLSDNKRLVDDIKAGITKLGNVSVNNDLCVATFLRSQGII